jgi:hypothetical protein
MTTKSEKIRETYRGLPVGSSNRDVAAEVERRHGFTPTPQAIYGAVGAETAREAHTFTGPQVLEAKATAQHFPSMDAYHDCVGMLRRIGAARRVPGGTLE